MRNRILAIIAVMAVISSVFVSGAAVFAANGMSTIDVHANGGSASAGATVSGDAYTSMDVNADGHILHEELSSGEPHAVAEAVISTDDDSNVLMSIVAADYGASDGWVTATGEATAKDGATASIDICAGVDDSWHSDGQERIIDITTHAVASGPDAESIINLDEYSYVVIGWNCSGSVVIDAGSTAIGQCSRSEISIGAADIDYAADGEINLDLDSSAEGYRAEAKVTGVWVDIMAGSDASVGVDAAASASGAYSHAWVTDINIQIPDYSKGSVDYEATASAGGMSSLAAIQGGVVALSAGGSGDIALLQTAGADGDCAQANIAGTTVYITGHSTGSIDSAISCSASGADAQARVYNVTDAISGGSSDSIDSDVTASASYGAEAQSTCKAYISNGDSADISLYSFTGASGEGAYAATDICVESGAPAGAYIDVAGDANGYAIAFVLVYGDNQMMVVGYASTSGGTASVDIDASESGVTVDAVVGLAYELIGAL